MDVKRHASATLLPENGTKFIAYGECELRVRDISYFDILKENFSGGT
jgi:hypothetical protein